MPERIRTAAVALGSNLPTRFGDRAASLRMAVALMGNLGEVTAVSSFFETAPEINTKQPRFLNAAALLRTAATPEMLMRALLEIEAAMGRERAGVPAKGPRGIDLDLLLMDDLTWDSEMLRLPHPAMAERRFVLEPLAEIVPDWMHPVLGRSVRKMLDELSEARNSARSGPA